MGDLYTELLSGVKGLELPAVRNAAAENIYWVYAIALTEEIPFDAAEMMGRLNKHGIGTRPFFRGMHEQPMFQRRGLFKGEKYPVAERISRRSFYLPNGPGLTEAQFRRSADALEKVLAGWSLLLGISRRRALEKPRLDNA